MRLLFVFFLIFSMLTPSARAEDIGASYIVTGVTADVSADSAAHARDQALAEAQRTAFTQLLERIGASPAVIKKVSDDDIAALVKSFEVENERASAVRYIGIFTIQFRPNAVRAFLEKVDVSYTDTRSKPLLVLPILKTTTGAILWEDKTKWRTAWDNLPDEGLVPVLLPKNDKDDAAILSTTDAMKGKGEALKALSDKYQAGGIVIATLTVGSDVNNTTKVDIAHYDADGNPLPLVIVSLPAPTDAASLESVYPQAVKLVRRQLEKDWRDQAFGTTTSTTPSEPSSSPPVSVSSELPMADEAITRISATVPVSTLSEWTQVKRKLESIPIITRTKLVTLQRGSASIEIDYRDSVDALEFALEQQDLYLTQDVATQLWTLQPSATGAF